MKTCRVTQEVLDKIYAEKTINAEFEDILDESIQEEPYPNEFFILKTDTKASAIVRYLGNDTFKLVDPKIRVDDIKPKDAEQAALMELLNDPDIKIISVVGPPGAGKTFISLAYGLTQVIKNKKLTLICTKSTETVKSSKFFGPVPGTVDDKFGIFLESFDLAMKKILHDGVMYQQMKDNRQVLFKPIEFCRGDSRENTILVCDESQNMGWHEVKTLLSRFGEDCKVILLGDLGQKDVRPNDKSGFESLFNSRTYSNSKLTGHIRLINDYRGPISRLISEIAKEVE